MENLSNNKQYIKSSPWFQGLLLPLLCCLFPLASKGQTYFNRLYTLNSDASEFHAIAPQGNDGGFMTVAASVDSISGDQGIRISRFSADGVEEKGTFFNLLDYPSRRIFVNYKCITKIDDNNYAIAGVILPSLGQYSFLLNADSNGIVNKFTNLTDRDSINYVGEIRYDGLGHILVAGYFVNKAQDSSSNLLYKLDTNFNLIWVKKYHPSSTLPGTYCFSLIVDSTGYVLCGGGANTGLSALDGYKCQSSILKTDTGGIQQWYYTSAVDSYKHYNSYITSALHTQDGGYLFVTKGDVYNSIPDWAKPRIDLVGKTMIVKLDAARKKLWEIKVDSFYTTFGLEYHKIIELKDSSFIFCGAKTTDSTAPNYTKGKLVIQHYNIGGKMLYQHILHHPPKLVSDTSSSSGGPVFDIIQTIDKGFVLCGYYLNYTKGAPAPAQRGWLIKLDSNGCLGVGDPECWPTNIPPFNNQSKFTLNIFPNPSNNHFEVDFNNEDPSPAIITITDLSGRAIAQYPLPQGKSRIEAQAWASGLYFYSIRQGNRTLTNGKLMKQ